MNTTALAIIHAEDLDTIQRAARLLAVSNYFDGKGDTPQAIAMMATKIMAGREMGFGPFASVNGVHIIQGKPSIGANLMASAVKSSGRYNYKVLELTAAKCTIEFFEREGDKWKSAGVSTFTIEDARTAGLSNKEVWKSYPKNMLFARAMSNGVRWFCADVFSGNAVYLPEELGAEVDGEGNVIEVEARHVDTQPSLDNDVPFDKPTQPEDIDGLLKQFNTLGNDLYGDSWEAVCRRNVERISGGKTKYVDELSAEQIQKLVDGMWKLQERRKAEAAEPVA